MKDDGRRFSLVRSECATLCAVWRGVGYIVAIAGVFALLAATGRSQEQVRNDLAKAPSEYRNVVVPPHRITVALHSREQPDDVLPTTSHESLLSKLGSFAILAGGSELGRCDRKTACHYSVTLAGPWDTQAVYTSEADAAETFRSACAARDLNALSRIERLGFSGDVPPEKVAAAAVTLFSARTNCAQGRVTEAFEQYENLLANTVASDGAR